MQIYENELMGFFFAPLGPEKVELGRRLGAEKVANLREALAETLLEIAKEPASLVATSVAEIEAPLPFKSILLKRGRTEETKQVIVFNFKDGFSDSALYFLGLLIAVSTPFALAGVVPALAAAKSLWPKLMVLRAPQDADAISLLDAIGRVGAANLSENREAAGTWEEVVAASKLESKEAITALKSLRAKKILEIDAWGGQAEDLENLSNRWRVRF